MIGQTISHYKILEKLGEGGMGVVYKAKDTMLNRYVALKFLPSHVSATPESKSRFLQEAQSAAGLNHPNICTIHGFESEGDSLFIVMECVEGSTLRKKLPFGKVSDAISCAIQIGEALHEAHGKGVVHRDVKADNIMLNAKGQVKVMDFGLAKLKGSLKLTKTSSTVGTLAYMSPEQIQGGEVDSRSDIFSYGVLLFEMLTGRLPFRGEHEAAMVYSIVNEEPESLLQFQPEASTDIQYIITKALQKDSADRYQNVIEMVVDLRRVQKQSSRFHKTGQLAGVAPSPPMTSSMVTAPSPPSRNLFRYLTIATSALLLLAVVAILFLVTGDPRGPRSVDSKISKVTFGPGLEDEPAWSPDGKFLAYTTDELGNLDIVVLPLAGGQPIRVAQTPYDEAQPAWSPDGSNIAFVSSRERKGHLSALLGMGAIQPFFNARGGDIFLVPAFGGNSVKIADNGYYPAWSPDGKQIAYQSDRDGSWRLWTVSAHGGEPQKLTNNPGDSFQPSWSSDGKWIVYMSRVLGFNISVVASTGGIPRKLLATDQPAFRPAWGQDGKSIIFSTNKSGAINLWSIPFFPSDDTPAEPWDRVTFGEGSDANVTVSSVGNKIAFSTLRTTLDIWELTLSSGKLRQVTFETSSEDYPQLSPDGSTLLVVSDRGGKSNIWLMDLNGKVISQMSSQTGLAQPRWSPNGKTIVWSLSFEGRSSIVTQNLGEASLTEVVSDSGASSPSWSPDGNQLAFSFITNGFHNIFVWTLQKHELRQLTFFESTTLSPSWSPDGKHITFQSNDKKGRHLWIAPARGGSPTQMTFGDSEDSHPQWSPRDKDVILFLRDHKNLFLLSVNTKKVRQITNFVEANILTDYPSWSFDGKKIYFSYLKKAGDVYVLENY